jgi:hypothetical protein
MEKKMCPKCKGEGCSHCGGTGYHKTGMAKGGDMGKKPMNAGMAKKKMGYAHGGLACGASNKPSQAGTRSIKT